MAIYFRGQKVASGTDKSGVVPSGLVSKTSIGLGNVDNTSDINKPLSTATINALAQKEEKLPTASYEGQCLISSDDEGSVEWGNPLSIGYLTTAPNSPNTEGIKIVLLSAEPLTKYSGYIYIIAEED